LLLGEIDPEKRLGAGIPMALDPEPVRPRLAAITIARVHGGAIVNE
jgi:hypothetical protein